MVNGGKKGSKRGRELQKPDHAGPCRPHKMFGLCSECSGKPSERHDVTVLVLGAEVEHRSSKLRELQWSTQDVGVAQTEV